MINDTSTNLASEEISASTTEILKSIDYHFPFTQASATSIDGTSGPRNFCLLFPLRVAYQVLSQFNSPQDVLKREWLEDVLYIIRGRAGAWMSNDQIFDAKKAIRSP
jgi:hypothetical protein